MITFSTTINGRADNKETPLKRDTTMRIIYDSFFVQRDH